MPVLTSFLMFFLQWLARRGLELGGLLLAIGAADPNALQMLFLTVGALLTGQWDQVSLGAVAGLVSVISGLVWNAKSTFQPQVVTSSHKRKNLPVLTDEEALEMNNRATGHNQTHIPRR